MDFTYDGNLTGQQRQWIQDALDAIAFPYDDLTLTVHYTVADEPPCPGHKDYMCTSETGGVATTTIRTGADDPSQAFNQGLPNPERDIHSFYRESIIHELGHAVHFARITTDAQRTAAAALFYKHGVTGEGTAHGTLADWDPLDALWEDRIQEAIAEVFKDTMLTEALRVYENRTHWGIDEADHATLMQMILPPHGGTPSFESSQDWFLVPPIDTIFGDPDVFVPQYVPLYDPDTGVATGDFGYVGFLGPGGVTHWHDDVTGVWHMNPSDVLGVLPTIQTFAEFEVLPADPLATFAGGVTLDELSWFRLYFRVPDPDVIPFGVRWDSPADVPPDEASQLAAQMTETTPLYFLDVDGVEAYAWTFAELTALPLDENGFRYVVLDPFALEGKTIRLRGTLFSPSTIAHALAIENYFHSEVFGWLHWWWAGPSTPPDLPGSPPYPYSSPFVTASGGWAAAIRLEEQMAQLELRRRLAVLRRH